MLIKARTVLLTRRRLFLIRALLLIAMLVAGTLWIGSAWCHAYARSHEWEPSSEATYAMLIGDGRLTFTKTARSTFMNRSTDRHGFERRDQPGFDLWFSSRSQPAAGVWSYSIPLWGLVLALAGLFFVAVRTGPLLPGQCPSCRYDLTGIEGECPECRFPRPSRRRPPTR